MIGFSPPQGGIQSKLLLQQVKNTSPYLFSAKAPAEPYIEILHKFSNASPHNHLEYFSLCLAAHYASVASFVPTDVDNQIRHKLWQTKTETTIAMAELVLSTRPWNFRPVSARGVYSHDKSEWVAGHHGEWFSMAVGAYAAHRDKNPNLSEQVFEAIRAEILREKKIFASLLIARDGCGTLKACTVLAHNLGDLDRVQDQWELHESDPLRQETYKLGHSAKDGSKDEILALAGELNKAFMAVENHRHFALREPRCLRQHPDFLLPIGPFFDDWGKGLAKHPELSNFDIVEIANALLAGMDRLEKAGGPQAQGYPRALAGLAKTYPGGLKGLAQELSAKDRKRLTQGPLHILLQIPQDRFEQGMAKAALDFVRSKAPDIDAKLQTFC